MKVALLSTHSSGGAGIASVRLHEGLRSIGIDSTYFCKWAMKDVAHAVQLDDPEIRNDIFDTYVNHCFMENCYAGNTMCSALYPSIGFDFLKKIQDFDVINLHWITSFISLEAITKLGKMGKPIVWTLHDQNPMTGACHYASGCEKYKEDCSNCPQLKENRYDITKTILAAKIKYLPKQLVVVSPSQWLADCARESKVFHNHRIEVIPNGIDNCATYVPVDRNRLRKKLSIPESVKIILFGAYDLQEKRKNVQSLIDAVVLLKQDESMQSLIVNEQVYVLAFGQSMDLLDILDIPHKALGYITDEQALAEVYSAADVVALPSLEDNLPNIMLEGLSCGTPIVAFATGGMLDVIKNGKNGFLAQPGDVAGFSKSLVKVLSGPDMRPYCREFATKNFYLAVQANRYRMLFEELVKEKHIVDDAAVVPAIFPEIASGIAPDLLKFIVEFQDKYNALIKIKNDGEDRLTQTTENFSQFRREQQERDIKRNLEWNLERDRLTCTLNGLEKELQAIYGSRSWKVAKFLQSAARIAHIVKK